MLGKPLHYALKTLNFLSQPMVGGYDLYSLPDWYCNLALIKFKELKQELNHRREIAKIYTKGLNKKTLNPNIINKISISANLRFPIFVENRRGLIRFLKKYKIFVSDIWYKDVAPECPNAVELSKKILNLPTHINVTKNDALRISEKVNEWLRIK
jgi:dTDP-4-amino-4,6-dideoxygalactose transaminase